MLAAYMNYTFKNTVLSFRVFLGAVLMLCSCLLLARTIDDPDIWWHLRDAEYLWTTHHFIHLDMYSYSVAGTTWINHEWLAELPYYAAWRFGGLSGVFLLTLLLIQGVILGTYYLACLYSGNIKAAFLATWFAIFLASVSFAPRMLLFGWLCLIILLALLWRFRLHGRAPLWLLPLLFLFWVNSHGTWLIGIAFFALYIVCGAFHSFGSLESSGPWTPPERRKLTSAFLGSVAALFVNPYGYKLVAYPFLFAIHQKLNVGHVQEWASTDFHSTRGKILLGVILATIGLSAVSKRRWTLESLAYFLVVVYAAVTYSRFMFLAAIVLTPLIAARFDGIPAYDSRRNRPVLHAAFLAVLVLFLTLWLPAEADLRQHLDQVYPTQATSYLRHLMNRDPGRLLNQFEWGGYLIWTTRDVPVMIDSRVDIFEEHGIVKDYLDFLSLQRPVDVLEKYDIRYVLLDATSPQASFLKNAPGWRCSYADKVAVVFIRDDGREAQSTGHRLHSNLASEPTPSY